MLVVVSLSGAFQSLHALGLICPPPELFCWRIATFLLGFSTYGPANGVKLYLYHFHMEFIITKQHVAVHLMYYEKKW